jgi:putative PEP-CTERM system TPR-repeat lipoprotein
MSTHRSVAFIALFALLAIACQTKLSEAQYLVRGKKLLEKKDYAHAMLEFKNAATLAPKDAEPYYQASLASLAMGEYGRAYSSLLKAVDLNPDHRAAQVKIAELIGASVGGTRDLQQLKSAEERINSVLAAVPDSPDALGALGLTEYIEGKSVDAIRHLQAALEKFPQHLQAAKALAQIKLNQGDLRGAEQVLKSVAERSPKSVEAHLALAKLYVLVRRPAEAEAEFRKAVDIDPQSGAALLAMASFQLGAGKKDDAEEILSRLSAVPDRQYRHLHASYLFQQGRRDEAIKEFEKITGQDPSDRQAFIRLTSAYFLAKRFLDAERVVDAALKRNPKDTNALVERGKLDLLTGKLSTAEDDLNQALHFDPNLGAAYYLRARVYFARGQKLLARQQLGKALDFQPGMLAARLELAESLVAAHDTKAALELLEATPENQKKILPVTIEINWALLAAGDKPGLRKSINAGLAIFPNSPDLVMQDGITRFQAKDIAGARKSLEQVLVWRPNDTRALDILAKTYTFEKQPDNALRTIEQYASRQAGSAQMQGLLGDWLVQNNRRDEARKAYAAALAADPSVTRVRIAIAYLDMNDGKLDSARQTLESVSRIPSFAVPSQFALALLEERANNTSAAIAYYRKVLEADPNNAPALNNLAYHLTNDTDQVDEGLNYAQRAKEFAPNSTGVEDTIGWAFYRKGFYDTAVQYLESAVAKKPTALAKYHLAMAYFKAGRQASGIKVLAQARLLDPKLPESTAAQQLLASLNDKRK